MGNRTSQPHRLGKRHFSRNSSRLDSKTSEQRSELRRSGSVQAYLQSPSTTLAEYLHRYPTKNQSSGDPVVQKPLEMMPSYSNAYSEPPELIMRNRSRSAYGLNQTKKQPESSRRDGRWFHEMHPRTKKITREQEPVSIDGATTEVDFTELPEMEAPLSQLWTDAEEVAPDMRLTYRHSSASQYFGRNGDRPSLTTLFDHCWNNDLHRSRCDRYQRAHSCYCLDDPRAQDVSEISSRSSSVHPTEKSGRPVRSRAARSLRYRSESGDAATEGRSASNIQDMTESRDGPYKSYSVLSTRTDTQSTVLPRQMGFQTEPDGLVTYTVFLRSGPLGVPVDGWLSDIRRRASRHLAGLHRQYQCTVRIEPNLISYRGFYVHALLITGTKRADIIRCRNALPLCIEKYLITPYANHDPIICTH